MKTPANLIPFSRYLERLEVSAVTGWRWRKRGWISTAKVGGRIFVTRDEIRRFEERVAAGAFIQCIAGLQAVRSNIRDPLTVPE